MMRSLLLLAVCVGSAQASAWKMPETWSEAFASVKHEVASSFSGGKKIVAVAHNDQLKHTEVHEHRAHTKMKLRSVLASEVGIVHKTEYWGKIMLGTPAKEFTVIFDTGSGNLILPSTKCNSLPCNNHEKYHLENSKSGMVIGKQGLNLEDHPEQRKEATIRFGTGKIHGQFYQDKLCLGGDRACFKANFIGTDYESEMPFDQCSFDGIMGLGFKDLSMGEGFNMVDDVVSQHSLPKNQFSVYLKDDYEGSEISFGGYKRSQIASEVVWAPVTRQSYWQIAIDDVMFNNEKTGLCSGCQVAVDTGTSLLAGPTDVVEKLGTKLDLKQDCSNFNTLPLLGFSLGDTVLNLLPDDYIDRAGNVCSLALMTLDVPPPKGPLFIFGDPFLRRYLTVYDREGPRVGFAVAQHKGVDAEFAKKLIHNKNAPAAKPAEEDLIKLDSKMRSVPSPIDTPAALRGRFSDKAMDTDSDPFDVIDHESMSWGSMFKKDESKKKAVSGMLQTTEEDEDKLITISLARNGDKK